jgi:uncharacterized protein DUF11
MSIKQNIKRRAMMVMALTMTLAVLTAGTAHAGTRAFGATLTNSPSQTLVGVGETMHFDVMLTNKDSVDVSGKIRDSLPANVKFVSAYSPQGPCIYEPGGANGSGKVNCEGGTLAPGESTNLSIAVVPQKAGILTNVADDTAGNEVSASAVVHPAS